MEPQSNLAYVPRNNRRVRFEELNTMPQLKVLPRKIPSGTKAVVKNFNCTDEIHMLYLVWYLHYQEQLASH